MAYVIAFSLPAILFFLTLLLWGLAGYFLLQVRRDATLGVAVQGEVTGFSEYNSSGQLMYSAKYRVVLADGRAVTGSSSIAKNWKSPSVGTRVNLHYRADKPDDPLRETSLVQYLLPVILFGCGMPLAALTVGGVFGAYKVVTAIAAAPSHSAPTVSPSPPPLHLTLANLGKASFDGNEPLDAPGYAGTLGQFDASGSFAWAHRIGVAWAPDAVMVEIRVVGCNASGIVDLSADPDAEVSYAYFSPSRVKQVVEATTVKPPRLNVGLDVHVRNTGVTATREYNPPTGGEPPRALAPSPCSLAAAMSTLVKAKALPERPIYGASLYFAGEHAKTAVWIVHDLRARAKDAQPVDATTCKIAPWGTF